MGRVGSRMKVRRRERNGNRDVASGWGDGNGNLLITQHKQK